MKINIRLGTVLLSAALIATFFMSCSPAEPTLDSTPQSDIHSLSGTRYRHNWYWSNDRRETYTKADYDLVCSFQTEDYQKRSVAEFDRNVLNWEDEEKYHKTEDALLRLFNSLPEDDPNAAFIFGTLSDTWDMCRTKHYNACQHEQNPQHGDESSCETYGDVYGDQVLLTGAYANFDFDYSIPDETALTVGEREKIFQSVSDGLREYLQKQSKTVLQNEEKMEKALTEELKRLLKAMDQKLVWSGKCNLGYYWEEPYGDVEESVAQAYTDSFSSNNEHRKSYSTEQYNLVLKKLKFEGYEHTSIAEFNRRIHALLYGDETEETFLEAYDMVMSYLPENDSNIDFFHSTVPTSLAEYEARAQEVYRGKQVDPSISDWVSASKTADVFGDSIEVGMAEADYTYTYRILDAEKLTVQERDQFLAAVKTNVQKELRDSLKKDTSNEVHFKALLETAGKAASNDKIQFTGCKVEYYDFTD